MTMKQRRQAIIGYAREEVAPGGTYSKGCGGMTWPSVLQRIAVPLELAGAFKTVDVVVGGLPRPELAGMPVETSEGRESSAFVDFTDLPLSMITVDPGVDVEISSKNESSGKLSFVAGLVMEVDVPAEEGQPVGDCRRTFDSNPITIAPGGRATLTVAPAEERPFSIEMLNLVTKGGAGVDRVIVLGMLIGGFEQLAGTPAPAIILHRCRMLMLPVIMTGQKVVMTVDNGSDEPATVNLKLEGVSLDAEARGVGLPLGDLLAKYGKFAQVPGGDDDDDDDDDEEEDD